MAVNWKKIRKISLVSLSVILLICGCLYVYFWHMFNRKYVPTENQYSERIGYINPENSLLSEGFETCGDYIYDYYNPESATYATGKNGLRKFILSNYINKDYQDSGYLNIRFVINCKGETGRYVVHENNLNLEPKTLDEDLKWQLFNLTVQLKKWNPNQLKFRDSVNFTAVDSYMYISYRIENGEITEIIP